MNYEEKYKEALKRARDMMSYKEVRRADMEHLFSELKESEDERIKREIIEYLKNGTYTYHKDWIAWLEKQGDNADKVKQQQAIEIPFGAKDSELQEATYYIPEGYHAEINGNAVVIKKGELINNVPSQDHWQDLRERVAIAAMQGVMNFFGSLDYDRETIAELAVKQADALVKELKGE